jgi:hypothetical protein
MRMCSCCWRVLEIMACWIYHLSCLGDRAVWVSRVRRYQVITVSCENDDREEDCSRNATTDCYPCELSKRIKPDEIVGEY